MSPTDLSSPICCPACRSDLEESAERLDCRSCKKTFPILQGIPRFVASEHYAGSFGFEWNKFDVQIPAEDDETFRVKTGWTPDLLKGKLVLDAGCGSGRYSAVAASWGARVFSMDMSLAVQKTQQTCRGMDVRIVQADLTQPPFAPATFDFVFSIGVLHHTPDTRRAFDAIAALVKPEGQLAVWLYRKNTPPQEWLNSALRVVTTRLPTKLLLLLCRVPAFLAGIPGLNVVLGRIANLGATHPDWRIRLCDAFDWYAPRYQFHHTADELRAWFKDAGFGLTRFLDPQRTGRFYLWAYHHNLLIGSGVNFVGKRTKNERS